MSSQLRGETTTAPENCKQGMFGLSLSAREFGYGPSIPTAEFFVPFIHIFIGGCGWNICVSLDVGLYLKVRALCALFDPVVYP